MCLCWLYMGSVWHHMVEDKGTTYSIIHNEKDVLKGWLLKERTLKLGSGDWIKSQDKISFLLTLLCVIHTSNDSRLLKSPGCLVLLLSHLHQFYIWILLEWENYSKNMIVFISQVMNNNSRKVVMKSYFFVISAVWNFTHLPQITDKFLP